MTSNLQPSTFNLRPKAAWFLAFAAVFAALAGYVFWGTWSLDFAPIMPDDTIVHSMSYADYWNKALGEYITNGQFLPTDILWKGLLVSPYFCQELKYASALFFSALGLAFFLRGRGLSHLASYGAGLLLAFCGYWSSLFSAGHGGWFLVITYATFDFGLIDRAVRRDKLLNWLLLGLVVGWSWLCQPDFCFIMSLLAVLYFAWCLVRERKFPWKGMLVSAALCAIIALPGFKSAFASKEGREEQIKKGETVANADKLNEKEKRWIFVTNWSLPADETAEFFIPRLNGDTSCPLTLSVGMANGTGVKPYTGAIGRPIDAKEGNYRQHSIYVGWVTCLLALLGIIFGLGSLRGLRGLRGLRSKNSAVHLHLSPSPEKTANCQLPTANSDIPFFIGAAILFYLLSLGRNFEPLYRLVFALPVGDTLRAPVKWHHATEFALVVLAGYGIEYLSTLLKKQNLPSLITHHSSLIVSFFLLFAAFDLARVDHYFCAPVNLAQVRRTNSNMQLNILRRQDFSNPQVAEMSKRGLIVPLAYYLGNPDYYLVEMLTPRKPSKPKPLPPMTAATCLGILSLCGTLFVSAFAVRSALRKESK